MQGGSFLKEEAVKFSVNKVKSGHFWSILNYFVMFAKDKELSFVLMQ